jgi:hypothetical protein
MLGSLADSGCGWLTGYGEGESFDSSRGEFIEQGTSASCRVPSHDESASTHFGCDWPDLV